MDYHGAWPTQPPLTVVGTPEFVKRARALLSDDAREELVGFLAENPNAGDVIPGTGGVRKLRWELPGRGKRGGARVIYFVHGTAFPLFLLVSYFPVKKSVQ